MTTPQEALRLALETLEGIANAKLSDWDKELGSEAAFKVWAQSRARHTVEKIAALSAPAEQEEAPAQEDPYMRVFGISSEASQPAPAAETSERELPPLLNEEQEDVCLAYWQKYLKNLNGAPLNAHETFRAAWFMSAHLAAQSRLPVADERAGFEQLVQSHGRSIDRTDCGEYRSALTDYAWLAWQGRAALPSAPAQKGPIGVAGTMPGTNGFTMACFEAAKVPIGTKLYATPPAPVPETKHAEANPSDYKMLQAVHARLTERCAKQDEYTREGMLKAINTVERMMLEYKPRPTPTSAAPAVPEGFRLVPITNDRIREIFLANGFTVKEEQDDLKPYVYTAARALLAVVPAVPDGIWDEPRSLQIDSYMTDREGILALLVCGKIHLEITDGSYTWRGTVPFPKDWGGRIAAAPTPEAAQQKGDETTAMQKALQDAMATGMGMIKVQHVELRDVFLEPKPETSPDSSQPQGGDK